MSSRHAATWFLSLLLGTAAAQDLPAGFTLPEGMTADQAKSLAQQNGVHSSTTSGASSVPNGATNVADHRGEVSPHEGDVESDTLDSLTSRDSEAREGPYHRRRLLVADSLDKSRRLQRYGQSVFRDADPSMFASHVGAVGADYQLGAGDELILTLWGQKEARYQLELDRDGQTSIEGIGVVSLNGQTVASATTLLRQRLQRIYSGMGSGRVNMDLTLGKLKQIRVFVVGDVVRQGGYLLSGNTSVFASLYQAKGPSSLGTEREVEIVRGKKRLVVDLYDYFFRGEEPVGDILQDGDVVRVPPHGPLIAIRGDVGRPDIYELKGGEGAKDLLEYAGGLLPTAASTAVTALRIFQNGRIDAVTLPTPKEILAGAPAPLHDGDTVFVAHGKDPSAATVAVGGQVRFPGIFPISMGKSAADFLQVAGGPGQDAYTGRVLLSRRLNDGSREQLRFSLETAASLEVAAEDSLWVYDITQIVNKDSVRISGAVHRPGFYRREEGMTVKDLILKAGGFQWGADWSHIRLETPIPGESESRVEVLSLDSSLAEASGDHPVPSRSHVAVPLDPKTDTLEMVGVGGWIGRPGRYALLHSGERLSSLWTRLGGLQPDAYLAGARLIRGDAVTGRIQIDFSKALQESGGYDDLPLRSGDSIYVPMRPATVAVHGRVNSPSNIVWREGKKWSWYVEQAGGFSDSADEDKVYVRYADGSVQTRAIGISDRPNPGSEVIVPFKVPPEPTTAKDVISGLNLLLTTAIAGVTVYVLLRK
jgi:protein involved in polysaccharide export with SLBB domain